MNIEPYYIFNGHAFPPQKAGCYSFYNRFGVCLYVGQSKNLKNRYLQHRSTCDYLNDVHFIGIWLCKETTLDIVESWLYTKLQPIKNKLELKSLDKGLDINGKSIELVSTKLNHNGRYTFKHLKRKRSIDGDKWI